MRKIIALCALVVLSAALGAALENSALVRSVSGRVEYREASEAWKTATEGTKIPIGATVSTGFDSHAVLEIGTASLEIAALTRMTIREIVEKNGVVKTELRLQVGKVKAQVKKAEGIQNDFTLKSPVTTASVRGTSFDFDSVNLDVSDGIVLMTDLYGQTALVRKGERATGTEGGSISGGSDARESGSLVSWDTSDLSGPGSRQGGTGAGTGGNAGVEMGSVSVHWQYSY